MSNESKLLEFQDKLLKYDLMLVEDGSRISGLRVSCSVCTDRCATCSDTFIMRDLQRELDTTPEIRERFKPTHLAQILICVFTAIILILVALSRTMACVYPWVN